MIYDFSYVLYVYFGNICDLFLDIVVGFKDSNCPDERFIAGLYMKLLV